MILSPPGQSPKVILLVVGTQIDILNKSSLVSNPIASLFIRAIDST